MLPLTRWSAVVLIAALLAGGITLGFPGATAEVWAGTVPPRRPGLGVLRRADGARPTVPHRRGGFREMMLFAVPLTDLSRDRSADGHPAFWLWLAPRRRAVLVPSFWVRHRRRADPDRPVPRPVRLVPGAAGAAQLLVVLAVPRATADLPTPAARSGFLAALGLALAFTAGLLLATRRAAAR